MTVIRMGHNDQVVPSSALVSRIIDAQFAELRPVKAVYLGEGYDSTVFEVSGEWIFRFPKRADVEQQLFIEHRILPVLSAGSPLPIPAFCFDGRPSPEFPRSFVGYRKLPGVPAIQIDSCQGRALQLASTLGRFLSWLHAFPVKEAIRCGVPNQQIESLIEEVRSEALADFDLVRPVAPDAPLDRWYQYLRAGVDRRAQPPSAATLVHNDLAAEHVLVDLATRTVTGVIDWSDIAVGDPAIDFAGMFHWGGHAFAGEVLAAYDGEIADTLVTRARFLGACRGVGDVVFGLDMRRPEYVVAGIRALHLCAGV